MSGVREHLLVIRLSAMGDVAMIVPALLALKASNPHLKITVITKDRFVPIFNGMPGVATLPVSTRGRHKGLLGIWRLASEIFELKPTAVADLHNVLRTRMLKVFLSGRRIPFVSLDKNRKAKRKLTRKRNKVWEPLTPVIAKYEEVFHKLGFESDVMSKPYFLLARDMPKNFRSGESEGAALNIGIAPFAAHPAKCYPENLMERVIEGIGNAIPCKLFLFGGGKVESDKLAIWENKFPYCISVAGKGSFSDELALISNMQLMVSMDSGNGHLAAMYGIPVITLWGLTHPYAGFSPYNQPAENSITATRELYPEIPTSIYGNRVPVGYERAMETIKPESVIAHILDRLRIDLRFAGQVERLKEG